MQITPFVPAHNSRNRVAAIALYRALVRAGRKIPLSSEATHQGPVHPVAYLVRRRFENHKHYTSLRLVHSSFTVGYKFLTLFVKAQSPESPEHAEVIQHLRKRNAASEASRATRQPREPKIRREPLLIRKSTPGHSPEYIPNELFQPPTRPPTADRPRRVPAMVVDAYGQPFLRYRKPQPRVLSKMLGIRRKRHTREISAINLVELESGPSAAREDEWERLVEIQMARELKVPETPEVKTSTYLWSELLAKMWWEYRTDRTHQDWVARGEAMYEILRKERALAAEETGEKLADVPPPRGESISKVPMGSLNMAVYHFPTRPILHAVESSFATLKDRDGPTKEDLDDPFRSPAWALAVKKQTKRLEHFYSVIKNHDSQKAELE